MRPFSPAVPIVLTLFFTACAPHPAHKREVSDRSAIIPQQQQEMAHTLEQMQDELQMIESRQRAQQQAIDDLRSALSAQKVTPSGENTDPSAASPLPMVEEMPTPAGLYRKAFGDYAEGHLPQAIAGFEDFLRLHPTHEQAGNALYWLGECYYAAQIYPKAAETFGKVAESYPAVGRAPDALLRLSAVLREMQDERRAEEILDLLIERYPESAAARAYARE